MSKNPEAEQQSAAEPIALLLQERRRRLAAGTLTKENERHLKRVISHALLWEHSEAGGDKYKGRLPVLVGRGAG